MRELLQPAADQPAADQPATEQPTAADSAIVVTGYARNRADILSGSSVVSGDDLAREQRPTIGDTLARLPGVSATSFGPNASRPVLRGGGRTSWGHEATLGYWLWPRPDGDVTLAFELVARGIPESTGVLSGAAIAAAAARL